MTALDIHTSPFAPAPPTRRTKPVNDPTANLWACLDPRTDRLHAAHAFTGVDSAALLQLAAADALTVPPVRQRVEEGPYDGQFLSMIAAAEPMLMAMPTWAYDDELLRDARLQIGRAKARLAEHSYQNAPDASPRMRVNPSLASVLTLIDKRTRQQHATLLAVIAIAVEAGACKGSIPHLMASADGELSCPSIGQLSFVHPGTRGSDARFVGIRVGRIVIDVPDYQHQQRGDAWESLRGRSGASRSIVVFDPAEVTNFRDEIVAELR